MAVIPRLQIEAASAYLSLILLPIWLQRNGSSRMKLPDFLTNYKNRTNACPYMTICWADVLAIVPPQSRFLLFVGFCLQIAAEKNTIWIPVLLLDSTGQRVNLFSKLIYGTVIIDIRQVLLLKKNPVLLEITWYKLDADAHTISILKHYFVKAANMNPLPQPWSIGPIPVKLFRRVRQHFRHFSPVLWYYRRAVIYRRIL